MHLNKDLREFIGLLNSEKVEYVLVGGYALAFHGAPRYTGDIDFLIRPTLENGRKVEQALRAFGFASMNLNAADFALTDQIVQLGQPPFRIDILTSISGLTFEEIWETRIASDLEGLPVTVIGRAALIRNKKASGRPRDLADLTVLDT
jgi:hypothetical protein